MIVGIPKESLPGERGVALTPAAAKQIVAAGLEVEIESGAGAAAGFPDEAYAEAGATIVAGREACSSCQLMCRGQLYDRECHR